MAGPPTLKLKPKVVEAAQNSKGGKLENDSKKIVPQINYLEDDKDLKVQKIEKENPF